MTELQRKISVFSIVGLMGLTSGALYNYYETLPVPVKTFSVERIDNSLKAFQVPDESIKAQAAVVYDPVSGLILYQKNSQMQLPLASLTKLATARAILSSTGSNQIVTISSDAIKEEGDSHLRIGDVWRLGDLLAFGLTTSSNDAMAAAASVLSSGSAVVRMNAEAKKDGLAQSYFLNTTGLDISSTTAGAYGSALDVAHLVELMLREYPEIFGATTDTPRSQAGSGAGIESTTEPIWDIPGLIAAKTGYTDLAGGNLAVAVDLGLDQPVIAVVLGSSKADRFADVRHLIEEARRNLSN